MSENLKQFFKTLEENKDATTFGTLSYNVVSMEGLGMNPKDILSGKAQYKNNGTKVILGLNGSFTGKVNGTYNGRDFLKVFPDSSSFTNVHGAITTQDGQRIAVKILGETTGNGEVNYQIQLRSNTDSYNWINTKYLFAKGKTDGATLQSELTIYAFDENPLDNDLAWEDPDVSKVDYKNFPYTLEDFQADDAATIIYSGDGFLHTVESFGADINKVFTGQFPIPIEGIRMNGYFSGPTQGNINGVINGVNYLRIMPDGSMIANSKIIVNNFEGDTLLLEAVGAGFPETGPLWWETSRAFSNLEKYQFLTKLHNLGVGSTNVQTRMINYNHYGYETIKLKNQQ